VIQSCFLFSVHWSIRHTNSPPQNLWLLQLSNDISVIIYKNKWSNQIKLSIIIIDYYFHNTFYHLSIIIIYHHWLSIIKIVCENIFWIKRDIFMEAIDEKSAKLWGSEALTNSVITSKIQRPFVGKNVYAPFWNFPSCFRLRMFAYTESKSAKLWGSVAICYWNESHCCNCICNSTQIIMTQFYFICGWNSSNNYRSSHISLWHQHNESIQREFTWKITLISMTVSSYCTDFNVTTPLKLCDPQYSFYCHTEAQIWNWNFYYFSVKLSIRFRLHYTQKFEEQKSLANVTIKSIIDV